MKQKSGKFKNIGSALDSLSRYTFKGDLSRLMELERRWEEVVGPQLARVSRPAKVSKGELTIWAKEMVWVNSMLFLRSEIKSKVNAILGGARIEQVIIVQNNKASSMPQTVDLPPPAEAPPLTEAETMEMENALSQVPDSQLRSTFKRVILKSMGKKVKGQE